MDFTAEQIEKIKDYLAITNVITKGVSMGYSNEQIIDAFEMKLGITVPSVSRQWMAETANQIRAII